MNSVKGDFFSSFFPNGNRDALKISFPHWQVRKQIYRVCIHIARRQEVKAGSVAIAFFSFI